MSTRGCTALAAVILTAMLLACGPASTGTPSLADPATVETGRIAPAAPTVTMEPTPEVAALVALYHATNGESWTVNDNWLADAPIGTWYGVGVDGEGRVFSLALDDNQLTGEISPELGNLVNLQGLLLNYNQLTGEIPPELGNLVNLQGLLLGYNRLTGEIPPELGNLVNLEWLLLDGNQLTGRLPIELANVEVLCLFRQPANRRDTAELGPPVLKVASVGLRRSDARPHFSDARWDTG